MADSNRDHSTEQPAAFGKRLYRFLTRTEVLGAVYIVILCAAFVLETRAHRNLFYAFGAPLFLLHLRSLDWRWLKDSVIAQLGLAYVGYFLLCAFWSDGLSWQSFGDLVRVGILVLLFFVTTLQMGVRSPDFPGRLFLCYTLTAGVSVVAVFGAVALKLLPFGERFIGFGLATHPIIGATLYGVALLLSAFALLPRATTWPTRLAWLAVIALCAAFMVLSGSRGPLIALAAALAVGFVIAHRRAAILLLVLMVCGIGIGVLFEFHPVELLYQREQSGHFGIWQQVLAAIAERPWFGYGSLADMTFEGKGASFRSPHNLPLANQFYGGLPATILLAALLLAAVRQGWRSARAGAPIYLVLLVFGLVASLFDTRSLVQNLGREWITLWLPIALLAAQPSAGRP